MSSAADSIRRLLYAPGRGMTALVFWLALSMLGSQSAGWIHEVVHGGLVTVAAEAGAGARTGTGQADRSHASAGTDSKGNSESSGKSSSHYCQLVHAGTLANFVAASATALPIVSSHEVRRITTIVAASGQPLRLVYRSHAPPPLS